MSITPASIRTDAFLGNKKLNCGPGSKPCGNACIPKDHKCRASWNKPVKAVAAVGAAAGVGLVATAFLHNRQGMRSAARASIEPLAQAGFAAGNAARGNWTGAAKNMANVGMTGRDLPKNLKTVAQGYGTDLKNLMNRGRNSAFKARHHRQAKGGRVPGLNYDSIWADGFSIDTVTLTPSRLRLDLKCGKGSISPGEKCTKGSAQKAKRPIGYANPSGRPLTNRQVRQIERNIVAQEQTSGKSMKLSPEQVGLLIQTPGTQSRRAIATGMRGAKNKELQNAIKASENTTDPVRQALRKVAKREVFNRRVQRGVNLLGAGLALGAVAASTVQNRRRDSVYASGFTPDLEQLAI